jgi:hypothetical protein
MRTPLCDRLARDIGARSQTEKTSSHDGHAPQQTVGGDLLFRINTVKLADYGHFRG